MEIVGYSRAAIEFGRAVFPYLLRAMVRTSLSRRSVLTAGGLLAFFAFGFIDNLKGSLLPEVLRAENLDYAQGGNLLLAAYLGFVIATLATGFAADSIGNRRVLWLSGMLLCVGLPGLSFVSSLSAMGLLMFIVGLGLGAIEVGANGLMLELHPDSPGRHLNLLATFHGIGSLLVPLYVAGLITNSVTWQTTYMSTVLLAIPVLIIFQSKPILNGGVEINRPNLRYVLRIAFTQKMAAYYFAIAAYVAVELGIAAWIVEYMQQVEGLSVQASSIMLSAFFAMIMLGRLAGAWLVERVRYLTAVTCGLAGGTIFIAGGLYGPPGSYVLLPLAGLFFSIVFPTITAHVTGSTSYGRGTIMGILFTFGGIGGALGPWTIGQLAESTDLKSALAITIAFAMCSLITLRLTSKTAAKKQPN